jgi:hypothetical protein
MILCHLCLKKKLIECYGNLRISVVWQQHKGTLKEHPKSCCEASRFLPEIYQTVYRSTRSFKAIFGEVCKKCTQANHNSAWSQYPHRLRRPYHSRTNVQFLDWNKTVNKSYNSSEIWSATSYSFKGWNVGSYVLSYVSSVGKSLKQFTAQSVSRLD